MKRGLLKQLDLPLVLIVLILVTTSVAMIYSLTAGRLNANLVLNQAGFAALGMGVALLIAQLDYRSLRMATLPLFILSLGLLGLVLLVGTTVFGATRWIDLGGFQFQPSEAVKLILVLFASHVLSLNIQAQFSWSHFTVFVGAGAMTILLVLHQPDLGTAVVLTLVLGSLLAAAHLPARFWVALGVLAILTLPILAARLEDYQLARLQTFFRPTDDPLGAGYNVLQSLIAVGNGGLFGQGLGQGTQSQLDFLPVVHTDFIFAGIAESVGFIGSALLLVVFGALVLRTLHIARNAPDRFGRLLAVGIASLWLVQLAINVGMNLGLAPVTGIPLPFLSYGGTALVVNLAAVGVVQAIARRASSS